MEIEFDSAKERTNIATHGISLMRAVDLVDAIEIIDNRRDYGELRLIATGLIDGRVHVCVYTPRSGRRRIISLRRANRREVYAYRSAIEGGS